MNDIANALDWKPQNNDQNSFTDIWETDSQVTAYEPYICRKNEQYNVKEQN
jgi:hypothetical protein